MASDITPVDPTAPTVAPSAAKKFKYTPIDLFWVLCGIVIALGLHGRVQDLEAKTYDFRLRRAAEWQPVPDVSRTVLAPIDDNAVARYGRWPWSRDRWAPVLRSLSELGVNAVSFDVEFPEKSEPVLRRSVTGVSFQKLIEREIASLEVQVTPDLLLQQFARQVDLGMEMGERALQAAFELEIPALSEQVVSWLAHPIPPGTVVKLAKLPFGFLTVPVILDRARPAAEVERQTALRALAARVLALPPEQRASFKYGKTPEEIALSIKIAHPGLSDGDKLYDEAGLVRDAEKLTRSKAQAAAQEAIAGAVLDRLFEPGPHVSYQRLLSGLAQQMGVSEKDAHTIYGQAIVSARARALARAQVAYPLTGLIGYLNALMAGPLEEAALAGSANVGLDAAGLDAATERRRARSQAPFSLSRIAAFLGVSVKERLETAALSMSKGLEQSTGGLKNLMVRAVRNPDDDLANAIDAVRQQGMAVFGVFYTSGGLNLGDAHKESMTDEFIRDLLKMPAKDRLNLYHPGQIEEPYLRVLRGMTQNPMAGPEDPLWKELHFNDLHEIQVDLETAREQVLNQALDLELAGHPDLPEQALKEGVARRFNAPLTDFLSTHVSKLEGPARARALAIQRFLVRTPSNNLGDSPRFYSFTPPILEIARAYSGLSLSVMAPDPDGVMRRVPLLRRVDDGVLPGMSFMLFLQAMGFRADDTATIAKAITIRPGPVVRVEKDGKSLDIPVDSRGSMLLRMQGTEEAKLDRLPLSAVINYIRLKGARREIQMNNNPQEAETFDLLEEAVGELQRTNVPSVTLDQVVERARTMGSLDLRVIEDHIKAGERDGSKSPVVWAQLLDGWREKSFGNMRRVLQGFADKFRKSKDREAKLKRDRHKWTSILERADTLAELEFVKSELQRRLKGKMVIIGAAQTSNTDSAPTPFTSKDANYALHAHGAATLLSGKFIRRPSHRDATVIPIVVLAFAVGLILPRVPMAWGAMWTGFLFLLWGGVTTYMLAWRGVWIDLVSPWMSLGAVYLIVSGWRYGTVEHAKGKYREMFAAYLDERVIEQFLERPELFAEIGGVSMEITAFFSDIEGFTTISETLTPEALSKMLESYLSPMTTIIQQRGGLRDKYIGDAIVAMFGAPIPHADHAVQGCLASLEQTERLKLLKEDPELLADPKSWLSVLRAKGRDFNARMGVNTGMAKVGNFGSKQSKNYTMIGDTVNLAARLEGANKAFGTYLMISEFTYAQAREYIEARPLDSIRVKGKLRPVTVYELMAKKGKLTQLQEDVRGIYIEARELYLEQRFAEAIARFQDALKLDPKDAPSLTLMHRSAHFIEEPPAKDWDGTYDLKEK